jgi:hypothetical protein
LGTHNGNIHLAGDAEDLGMPAVTLKKEDAI